MVTSPVTPWVEMPTPLSPRTLIVPVFSMLPSRSDFTTMPPELRPSTVIVPVFSIDAFVVLPDRTRMP